MRTEQLQLKEDYRTSQVELSRVHNEHRLAQITLNEENRQSQHALLKAHEDNHTCVTNLKESHLKEVSNLAATHYTDQSKLQAMNLTLVADKQKLLLERSLVDGNDSVPGMFPPFSQTDITLLTTTVGSVNRAQTWAKVVIKNPGMQDLDYPLLHPLALIQSQRIADLADTHFAKEPAMYEPSFECLTEYFTIAARDKHPGCVLWDTHARRNLDGHSPDLTMSIANTKRPDATAAIAVWELKPDPLDDDGRGQVYDYLKIMSKKQPDRLHFIGVLSNLKDNIVITLIRERTGPFLGSKNWRWRCRSFKPMRLAYAIAYLRDIIVNHSQYLPSVPNFSSELGIIDQRLGSTTFSVIAAFLVPRCFREKRFSRNRWMNPKSLNDQSLDVFVVKRIVPARPGRPARSVKREIKILLRIDEAGGHQNLPQIVYHTNNFEELAITPYGYSLKPGDALMDWRKILEGVLSAIKWLHSKKIIHRDVRWDNIIWHNDHAVLIDLGASVYVPDNEATTIYDGGNICCPPGIIGKFNQVYLPSRADDCYAFFLLVNTLNWPERWKDIRTEQVADQYSEVATKLTAFWEQMKVSKVWSRYVVAAEYARYDVLEELLDCCVYFGGLGKT